MDLLGRSYLKDTDFCAEELGFVLDLADSLRAERREGREGQRLVGKNVALVFEKTSTRTRAAFEVAVRDQGAFAVYLGPGETQLGVKESAEDTARVLGRMFDGIEFRGFDHTDAETFAAHAGVPVWNGLTDRWHPTQSLAALLTMQDHAGGRRMADLSVCYLGDAANNTCASLLCAAATMGMDVRIAAPASRRPAPEIWSEATVLARTSGGSVSATDDPLAAVHHADFVYTDVWLSLGEPEELWRERIDALAAYQVTPTLMAASGNPEVKLLHCLPAFHDTSTTTAQAVHQRFGLDAMEVTDEVFRSPASLVFEEAENRLHTVKALVVATLAEPCD